MNAFLKSLINNLFDKLEATTLGGSRFVKVILEEIRAVAITELDKLIPALVRALEDNGLSLTSKMTGTAVKD